MVAPHSIALVGHCCRLRVGAGALGGLCGHRQVTYRLENSVKPSKARYNPVKPGKTQ